MTNHNMIFSKQQDTQSVCHTGLTSLSHDPNTPQGYLVQSLLGGIATAISHLSSTNNITSKYATAPRTYTHPSPRWLIHYLAPPQRHLLTRNTTANTGHQPPHPPNERLATINKAEEEELAAAVAAEAELHRTT
jgi:hypothetical protein